MLLVETTISELVEYVNLWNKEYALNMVFHEPHGKHKAWTVGNVLITGTEIAPGRVLCEFDNFDLQGANNVARRVTSRLVKLLHESFPVDDTPNASRVYGIMTRQAARALRVIPAVFADTSLDAETEADFKVYTRAKNPDITEEELSGMWQHFCQLVEQQRTKREEQEQRRTMTAEDAVAAWLSKIAEDETDHYPSREPKGGEGKSIALSERKDPSQPRCSAVWVAIGCAIVVAVTVVFFQPLHCVLEFRLKEATVTLVALLAVGAGAVFKIAPPQIRSVLQSIYGGSAVCLIIVVVIMLFLPPPSEEECSRESMPSHIVSPMPAATPTCPVRAATDAKTLFILIDAEARAVLHEDIELIEAIFAPDAVIQNAATQQEWNSPEVYYTEKFKNEVHCQAVHFDYRILKLTDMEALVTTASRGEWGWETQGCTEIYENPSGADQWYFRKDVLGCWRIVRFIYNAHEQ